MKSSPAAYLLVAIAIISGILVLAGYFFPTVAGMRAVLLDWAVIFAAVLLLMGVVSLVSTHWHKIVENPKAGSNSLVVLIAFILSVLVAAAFGPTSDGAMWLYEHVLIPIESSLLGILAIFLVYACARLFNQRMNTYTLIFIGAVLAGLVGAVTIPTVDLSVIKELIAWLSNVWAVAGARGILLGIALGTVATGLRILLGADRPYGG